MKRNEQAIPHHDYVIVKHDGKQSYRVDDVNVNANHRRTAVVEIDVEMKLESFGSFCLRSGQTSDCNSSKRSSSTSSYTAYSDDSSAGSGSEKIQAKYSNLSIAKILHTKERIRSLLRTPLDDATKKSSSSAESSFTAAPKRSKSSPRISKRSHHYSTLGHRTRSKLHNFSTLPPPSESTDDISRKNTSALVRSKSDVNQNCKRLIFDLESDWLSSKTLELEERTAKTYTKEKLRRRRSGLPFTKHETVINLQPDDADNSSLGLYGFMRRHPSVNNDISIVSNIDASKDDTKSSKPGKSSSVKSNIESPISLEENFVPRKRSFSTVKKRLSMRFQLKSKEASRKSLTAEEWLNDNYLGSPLPRRTLRSKTCVIDEENENRTHKEFKNKSLPMSSTLKHRKHANIFTQKSSKIQGLKERFTSFVAKRSPPMTRNNTPQKQSPFADKHQPRNSGLSENLSPSVSPDWRRATESQC